MNSKHGPNSWDNYLTVHQSCMRAFEHFVLEDGLSATFTASRVLWKGVIYCLDGIELHVSKTQAVEYRAGQPIVQTIEYSYHAQRRIGTTVTLLFRYDNIHVHPDHPDAHHRHRFDGDGNEIDPTLHVGEDGWPTLSDVLKEAFDLHHRNAPWPSSHP